MDSVRQAANQLQDYVYSLDSGMKKVYVLFIICLIKNNSYKLIVKCSMEPSMNFYVGVKIQII